MLIVLVTLGVSIVGVTAADLQTTSSSDSGTIQFFDKGYLNDPIMQFESDPLRSALDQHIFGIREGSIGGYDSAGGSCGCN